MYKSGMEENMKSTFKSSNLILIASAFLAYLLILPISAGAHCDTMDGPVVSDAMVALEKGDITPVLKWVKPEGEKEVRDAFAQALIVRAKGPEAKAMADTYFFETLVRVHRAGEGAPYTGLKPAGAEVEPAIVESDKALEDGSVDTLVKIVTSDIAKGIRDHYSVAKEAKAHKDDSIESGRHYVEAYVKFIHYVERLHQDASSEAVHEGENHLEE
jgi:hypothetical protein